MYINIMKNKMNINEIKKFIVTRLTFILGVILSIILLFSFYIYISKNNLQVFDDCNAELKNFPENHACIATNVGILVIELYPDAAPIAVNRFKELSNDKFYNGLEFYRVVKDFVIQGGVQDFYARRNGFEIVDKEMEAKVKRFLNDSFDVEVNFNNLDLSEEEKITLSNQGIRTNPNLNTRPFEFGSLSFANKGETNPNSNSTEIFIVVAEKESLNVRFLNGRFTNFGKVVKGLDVLKLIANTEIDQDYKYSNEKSKPLTPIKILEVAHK